MAGIACSAYQQSAQLSCQEIFAWRKVPSYLFGRWCYQTAGKSSESVGECLAVCKNGSNVTEGVDDLGPDADSSTSRAQVRSG